MWNYVRFVEAVIAAIGLAVIKRGFFIRLWEHMLLQWYEEDKSTNNLSENSYYETASCAGFIIAWSSIQSYS